MDRSPSSVRGDIWRYDRIHRPSFILLSQLDLMHVILLLQIWFYEYFSGLARERVLDRSFPVGLYWVQCRRAQYGSMESVWKAIWHCNTPIILSF